MTYIEHSYLGLNSQGFHKLVYSDWGPKDGRIVVCIHGLTGNGHDFDFIAPVLAENGYRVVALDLAGRGRSDFLGDSDDYRYIQYINDIVGLFAHLGIDGTSGIDWIGVSLGGLLGFRMAALPNSPIRRLIINDIGPHVPQADLDFIKEVLTHEFTFDDLNAFKSFMIETRKDNYGPMTDEHWDHYANTLHRVRDDGKYTYAFDEYIRDIFYLEPIGEVDLWSCWDEMTQPTLVLRGGKSTIFPQDVAQDMMTRGPGKHMTLHEFPQCGHVPSLMDKDQIDVVSNWLKTTDP